MAKATASLAGEVIAKSENTVLVEGNHYFPITDIEMDKLSAHDGIETVCHWKGTASYFDVQAGGEKIDGGAFQYKEPSEMAAKIKDHIAFWKGVEIVEN